MEKKDYNVYQHTTTQVRSGTQFSIADADYKEFSNQYTQQVKSEPELLWVGRKLLAIPKALFDVFLKVPYHLIKAAITAATPAPPSSSSHGEATKYVFKAARDLEEGLGQLVTVVNDVRGNYLIQEAKYHKDHYDHPESISTVRVNNFAEIAFSNAYTPQVKMASLQASVGEQQWNIIDTRYKLLLEDIFATTAVHPNPDTAIAFHKSSPQDLFSHKKVEECKAYLYTLKLDMLNKNPETLTLKELTSMPEDFRKMVLADLQPTPTLNPPENASQLSQKPLAELTLSEIFFLPASRILELKKENPEILRFIDPTVVGKLGADTFTPDEFKLLPYSCLKHLDLTKISADALHGIMEGTSIDQQKDLVKTLPVEQLNAILSDLRSESLREMPLAYLNSLDLGVLLDARLRELIGGNQGRYTEALKMLSTDKLQPILRALNPKQRSVIPLEKFKEMQQFKTLTDYFPDIIGHLKGRMADAFAIISTENLQSILEKLSKEQLEAIPINRLKDLKLSNLKRATLQTLIGNTQQRYKETLPAFSPAELSKVEGQLSWGASEYYQENIKNK